MIWQIPLHYTHLLFFLSCLEKKNIQISLYSLLWKFCENVQFPQSFGRVARSYAKSMHLRKISAPGKF